MEEDRKEEKIKTGREMERGNKWGGDRSKLRNIWVKRKEKDERGMR